MLDARSPKQQDRWGAQQWTFYWAIDGLEEIKRLWWSLNVTVFSTNGDTEWGNWHFSSWQREKEHHLLHRGDRKFGCVCRSSVENDTKYDCLVPHCTKFNGRNLPKIRKHWLNFFAWMENFEQQAIDKRNFLCRRWRHLVCIMSRDTGGYFIKGHFTHSCLIDGIEANRGKSRYCLCSDGRDHCFRCENMDETSIFEIS